MRLFLALSLLLCACGDDTTTPDGAGGSGGAGGAAASTIEASSSSGEPDPCQPCLDALPEAVRGCVVTAETDEGCSFGGACSVNGEWSCGDCQDNRCVFEE